MEHACSKYGATFDGRRKSVMKQTGFKRRVPIPVSVRFDIYAFPTHAIKDHACIWIFANHVQQISAIEDSTKGKSLIVFWSGFQFELEVSQHTLQKQLDRTEVCRYVFTIGLEQQFV